MKVHLKSLHMKACCFTIQAMNLIKAFVDSRTPMTEIDFALVSRAHLIFSIGMLMGTFAELEYATNHLMCVPVTMIIVTSASSAI